LDREVAGIEGLRGGERLVGERAFEFPGSILAVGLELSFRAAMIFSALSLYSVHWANRYKVKRRN
jgi:hypothetical protein